MANGIPESPTSHAQNVANWLDDRFTIPGTNIRFGLDPIIGLIPVAGDWVSGIISTYFIVLGVRADLPQSVLLRMGFNILLDVTIGSIPLLGDLFDFGWKANTKNAELLEKYRHDSEKTERHSRWLLWLTALLLITVIIALLAFIVWGITEIF